MQVWYVVYEPSSLSEQLYQDALQLVDPESRARIQRFHRREDAWRSLIGRLLPRLLLYERGVPPGEMKFGYTEAGKPYITSPRLTPHPSFNITHDAGIVAMGFSESESEEEEEEKVGVDVMKVHLPRGESFLKFVGCFGDQLTKTEQRQLLSHPPSPSFSSSPSSTPALRHFYLLWTLKEAYTKSLGLGLGFDFKRVEYDVGERRVNVDGHPAPEGWEFWVWDWGVGEGEGERYVGASARWVKGGKGGGGVKVRNGEGWCRRWEAGEFVREVLGKLKV